MEQESEQSSNKTRKGNGGHAIPPASGVLSPEQQQKQEEAVQMQLAEQAKHDATQKREAQERAAEMLQQARQANQATQLKKDDDL